MTEAYPLQWPQGKPRAKFAASSRFGTLTVEQARRVVQREVNLLGATGLVISTNIKLRQDGNPYSSMRPPEDKGVAIYFSYNKKQMCFACDRWDKIEHNLYAIAKTIDALRGIERWGSGDMVQQAFSGFAALPAPQAVSCWDILGITPYATKEEIESAYRILAKEAHPDMPSGSAEAFTRLARARNEAINLKF